MKQKSKQIHSRKDKKTYTTPILLHMGTIRELTKGAASTTNDMGGSLGGTIM